MSENGENFVLSIHFWCGFWNHETPSEHMVEVFYRLCTFLPKSSLTGPANLHYAISLHEVW